MAYKEVLDTKDESNEKDSQNDFFFSCEISHCSNKNIHLYFKNNWNTLGLTESYLDLNELLHLAISSNMVLTPSTSTTMKCQRLTTRYCLHGRPTPQTHPNRHYQKTQKNCTKKHY